MGRTPALALALVLTASGAAAPARAGRDFCASWAPLRYAEKYARVAAADRANFPAQPGLKRCLAGVRPAAIRTLDYECRNWTKLLDFEVRVLLDRVQARCSERS